MEGRPWDAERVQKSLVERDGDPQRAIAFSPMVDEGTAVHVAPESGSNVHPKRLVHPGT